MQKDYFEPVPGGVALNQLDGAVFVTHASDRLDKAIRYSLQRKPGKTRNIKQRNIICHEAYALANALLGQRDLPRVVGTRTVWREENALKGIGKALIQGIQNVPIPESCQPATPPAKPEGVLTEK